MLSLGKKLFREIIQKLGYDLVKISNRKLTPSATFDFTDLQKYREITDHIPGMIKPEAAEMLYAICVTQDLMGNVLEIGSWQGKSTSYLARAVYDSGNGRMFAVDHFKGNIGKENYYAVGGSLENLQVQFENNMRSLNLLDVITVLPYKSSEAYPKISDHTFRFLFIDGDHTEDGVKNDIELFCSLVPAGGIVVFDDFDSTFPGVITAAENWIQQKNPQSVFFINNMLVCKI